jgi:hypothetical protein
MSRTTLILMAVVAFVAGLFLAASSTTIAQIPDPCDPDATSAGGCLFVCPQGDGVRLDDIGATIDIWVVFDGVPVEGIPHNDIWVMGCDPLEQLSLCGGSQACSADGPTDSEGHTTISGTIAAGGYSNGLDVVVSGIALYDKSTGCTTYLCLPVATRSPDINGDLLVDLTDLATFASVFTPGLYDERMDFNCDGAVGLIDLSMFAPHFGPPGHNC